MPGNDDAMRAIKLYCESVADTIIGARGQAEMERKAKQADAPKKEEKTVRVAKKIVKKKAADKPAEEVASEETAPAAEVAPKKKRVVKKKVAEKSAEEAKAADSNDTAEEAK